MHRVRSSLRGFGPFRSGRLWPGVAAFGVLVWLVVTLLDIATTTDVAGRVPRSNLELGIDARALFYTEIDSKTPTPVIGMMPKATPETGP